jgi:hypothetical protein
MAKGDNNKDLENKFLFRLVKVLYIITLLFSILIFGIYAWEAIPERKISREESVLMCSNGKRYPLSDTTVYFEYEGEKINQGKLNELESFCDYAGYEIDFGYKLDGTWLNPLGFLFLGIGSSYVILNILRETLIYLFFGKKFDWEWIKSREG